MPVPSLEEQVEIYESMDTVVEKLEIHMRKILLEELFRTLLHQLMTAQIRVNEIDFPGFS